MNANRNYRPGLIAVAMVLLPAVAHGQAQNTQQKPGATTTPAQVKPQPKPPAPAAAPPQAKIQPPEPPTATPKLVPATKQPTLLGQYDNWGAYWAAPEGRKVCFAVSRPNGSQTNRGRNPSYLFITSRPHEKVKDEVSAVVSFTLKSNAEAMAVVGGKNYMMSSKSDGVWIKNQSDETKLVEAMRKGGDLVLKATTDRGLQSTDTFSMKGLAQALDRVARECK